MPTTGARHGNSTPIRGAKSVVIIGIDPHKSSLTAVAIDDTGTTLTTRRFVVNAGTPAAVAKWTSRWALRRFAIEGA
jgi:transposase